MPVLTAVSPVHFEYLTFEESVEKMLYYLILPRMEVLCDSSELILQLTLQISIKAM